VTGRRATRDVRPGRLVLSVGDPDRETPPGWRWVALSAVATMATGHTPSRKHPEYWGGEIPWMNVGDARPFHGRVIYETSETTNPLGIENSAAVVLPEGTVCLSRTGSIGYAVILGRPMATSQGFVNWICGPELLPQFLQQIFLAENSFLHQISEGVAHTTIYFPEAKAFHVCVPGIEQQRELVAELEKQFSRLDEAVANLRRAKANLKRHKAAILKAAVEGRLVPTEAELARREGRLYVGGGALVDRIRDTRRRRWAGKGKYKEPAAADVTCPPNLPEGWAWASLDALSWDSGYGTSAKCSYEGQGLAVLRIPNVQKGAIDLNDLKFAPHDLLIPRGELVDAGDMLIIRTNGSKALIGRAAIVSQQPPRPLAFASYLIRFRLCSGEVLGQWVNTVWAEARIRRWIEARAAASAGQHNIGQSVLAAAPIPIPPEAEQARIAAELDRRLTVVREVEAQVDDNLSRALVTRTSILASAFSGGLTR